MTALTALTQFAYNNTALCTPQDGAFQAWLGAIGARQESGLSCATPTPSLTPVPTSTLTLTPTLAPTPTAIPTTPAPPIDSRN